MTEQTIEEKLASEYAEYTNEELRRAWDYLEKFKLTSYVEMKMNAIDFELNRRVNRASMGGV